MRDGTGGQKKVAIPKNLCMLSIIMLTILKVAEPKLKRCALVISGCMFYKTRLLKLYESASDGHMTHHSTTF